MPKIDFSVAEEWAAVETERQAKLVNTIAGTILHKLGERRLRVTADDIRIFCQENEVSMGVLPDSAGFEFTILPKQG